ncbi:hypothetical protein O7623_16960 [Solwaraspora sp. WMMD791]|uniref:hypothetical protein n=1 Tax=Solwaraspora sp. WMMD791 TaxID=3016086 RepID=UPI00249ABD0A|nr:hypothetical protein [Solwaraspora sp. WMMD791]WFE25105.1 hypothetical protein O7623_16960 [Solwaraspora sp. WMMD791]
MTYGYESGAGHRPPRPVGPPRTPYAGPPRARPGDPPTELIPAMPPAGPGRPTRLRNQPGRRRPTRTPAPADRLPPGGRRPRPGPAPARPGLWSSTTVWQVVISGLSVLLMLGVCGLSSFFIVADERNGRVAAGVAEPGDPTPAPRDISSREVDPAPLTVEEVFPTGDIVIDPAEPPYQLLKTQVEARCRAAVAGDIGPMLDELGCNQVVRGTLRSPTGEYLITTGVFNLADATGAEWAHTRIKPLVDEEKGRFQGMIADEGTEAVALSSAQVGWHSLGHFLMYCVIARADGEPVPTDDPYARQILFDMLQLHLQAGVLEKRAVQPSVDGGR